MTHPVSVGQPGCKECNMDATYFVKNASTIPSPALLVYFEKLKENISLAISIAGDAKRLRPHIKTHKTKQIVALQQEAGIDKFKCATIAEAEMLAQCGVKDICLAYPMVGPNIARFIRLCTTYNDVSFALTDLPFGVVDASIEVDSTGGVDEFDEDNNTRDIRIENYAPADFNLSEDVDIVDLSVIAQQWLSIGDDLSADISPLFIGDGKVDLEDFAEFGKYWMTATTP